MPRIIRKRLDHTAHFAGRFGAIYFITICCQRRRSNQLCHQETAAVLANTARIYHEQGRWNLNLLLLMPDHLHALIGVHRKCIKTHGRVLAAGGVLIERTSTDASVFDACGVVIKGIKADCRVGSAGCETEKRIVTLSGVLARIASVRCRENPESIRGSAATDLNLTG